MGLASNVYFNNFCTLCSKISESAKQKKIELLSKYIENWRQLGEVLKLSKPNEEISFFPVLRFLLPQLDRDRGAYGIKENTLAKIYIRILCLPPNGPDAMKLLNYRAPKTAGNEAGDFASVSYWILKRRCAKGGELSIEDVNECLNKIAYNHTQHDPRGVDAELTYLLQNTSAEEQKWLIRIILKDMKLGMGQNSIFKTFHSDALNLYDVCNSLNKVCEQLHHPSRRLHEIEVELFSPFRPMLSEELDVRKVDSYFLRSPYLFVETKLDGERFQLHMENGKFIYFSRNGFEYTSNFGTDQSEGTLTPSLANQISSDVKSVILDGEMMCWNRQSRRYTTKGMDIDVKKLKPTNMHQPCFCVFDILFLNGEVLTNKSLIHRIELLEKAIIPKEGIISMVSRKRVSTKEEVYAALNDAMDNCEEGIVVKEFSTVYKPNVRKGGGWYKIKPEYTDGLMDTMDMVVIGGYHGGGRHKGGINSFLMGVASSSEAKTFLSCVRVGSGLSMETLDELQAQLGNLWHKRNAGDSPPNIKWSKEKPDVWLEPEKSIVMEVKASEIIPSDMYVTGYTLRFPRIVKVRTDKSWTDCITFAEFEEKRLRTSGKLTTSRLSDEDVSPTKVRRTVKSVLEVGSQFKASDTADVKVKSMLLENKEICVMNGGADKAEVERKIVENGGTFVQNPGINTWCVLAEEETFRVKNVMASKRHDVIRTSWLMQLLMSKAKILPSLPRLCFLGMSLQTEARMKNLYDEFGDHYTVPATDTSLKQSMELAAKIDPPLLTLEKKIHLDLEVFGGRNPYRIFRSLVVFVDPTEMSDFDVRLTLFQFLFNGGAQAVHLDDTVTHVMCTLNSEQHATFQTIRRERPIKFHIVSPQWVSLCLKSERLCDESSTFDL